MIRRLGIYPPSDMGVLVTLENFAIVDELERRRVCTIIAAVGASMARFYKLLQGRA